MARVHYPVALWWFPLLRVCACGAWRPCPPPASRIRDDMGDRIPDGDRVQWPVQNDRRATDRDSTRVRQHPDRGWRTEQNAQAAYRGESGAHRGEPVPPQDPDGDTDREPR